MDEDGAERGKAGPGRPGGSEEPERLAAAAGCLGWILAIAALVVGSSGGPWPLAVAAFLGVLVVTGVAVVGADRRRSGAPDDGGGGGRSGNGGTTGGYG
ncbi:hypothetical protein ACWEPM_02935 [Streptomyces sp. NPDC004244]